MYKNKIVKLLLVILILFFNFDDIFAIKSNFQLPEEVWQEISERETSNPENIESVKKRFERYLNDYENFNDEMDEKFIEIIDNPNKPFLMTTEKENFNFREGKGYFSDFWVNPEEALDLSLKFISNYLHICNSSKKTSWATKSDNKT